MRVLGDYIMLTMLLTVLTFVLGTFLVALVLAPVFLVVVFGTVEVVLKLEKMLK